MSDVDDYGSSSRALLNASHILTHMLVFNFGSF